MNYLTKTQLAIIVFFVPLVFKMAMLPSLFYEACGPDSYIGIAMITAVEFLQMGLVLFVVSKGGMEGIAALYGKNLQRLLAAPLIFVMIIKSLVFITEIQTYVCDYLFYNISPFPIICAIMVVIFYLALKGAKTIYRQNFRIVDMVHSPYSAFRDTLRESPTATGIPRTAVCRRTGRAVRRTQ